MHQVVFFVCFLRRRHLCEVAPEHRHARAWVSASGQRTPDSAGFGPFLSDFDLAKTEPDRTRAHVVHCSFWVSPCFMGWHPMETNPEPETPATAARANLLSPFVPGVDSDSPLVSTCCMLNQRNAFCRGSPPSEGLPFMSQMYLWGKFPRTPGTWPFKNPDTRPGWCFNGSQKDTSHFSVGFSPWGSPAQSHMRLRSLEGFCISSTGIFFLGGGSRPKLQGAPAFFCRSVTRGFRVRGMASDRQPSPERADMSFLVSVADCGIWCSVAWSFQKKVQNSNRKPAV